MKILGNLGIMSNYNKDTSKTSKEKEISSKKPIKEDKVEISQSALKKSDKAHEVSGLKAGALGERDNKISDLRDRIKAGAYKVSSSDVADAIIDSKRV